ncbi:Uncharacterised protein [Mycobacteroides abscessus subsp. abscessus]|nr:Uncharacterised protein [Mycobacteroides abscessus subsp. abscessus]
MCVFGVDLGLGQCGPRFRYHGGDSERGFQYTSRFDSQVQGALAAFARKVSDDDGHTGSFSDNSAGSLGRSFSALWCRPHTK